MGGRGGYAAQLAAGIPNSDDDMDDGGGGDGVTGGDAPACLPCDSRLRGVLGLRARCGRSRDQAIVTHVTFSSTVASKRHAPIKTPVRGCFWGYKDHTQTKPHFTPIDLRSKHSTTSPLELPRMTALAASAADAATA